MFLVDGAAWAGEPLDITTLITCYEYTALADIAIWIKVKVGTASGNLNGTGGTIRIVVARKTSAIARMYMEHKDVDTTLGYTTKTSVYFTFGPLMFQSGETMQLRAYSSNGADGAIHGQVWAIHHHAVSMSANDLPEVDAKESGAAALLSGAEVQSECQDAIEANDLHLVADGNGRVDVGTVLGATPSAGLPPLA